MEKKKKRKFDAVDWMRKRRAEIEREDEGLTWQERAQKTREILKDDPLWQHLKDRLAQPRYPRRAG